MLPDAGLPHPPSPSGSEAQTLLWIPNATARQRWRPRTPQEWSVPTASGRAVLGHRLPASHPGTKSGTRPDGGKPHTRALTALVRSTETVAGSPRCSRVPPLQPGPPAAAGPSFQVNLLKNISGNSDELAAQRTGSPGPLAGPRLPGQRTSLRTGLWGLASPRGPTTHTNPLLRPWVGRGLPCQALGPTATPGTMLLPSGPGLKVKGRKRKGTAGSRKG